jgi:hypothetical protein
MSPLTLQSFTIDLLNQENTLRQLRHELLTRYRGLLHSEDAKFLHMRERAEEMLRNLEEMILGVEGNYAYRSSRKPAQADEEFSYEERCG